MPVGDLPEVTVRAERPVAADVDAVARVAANVGEVDHPLGVDVLVDVRRCHGRKTEDGSHERERRQLPSWAADANGASAASVASGTAVRT